MALAILGVEFVWGTFLFDSGTLFQTIGLLITEAVVGLAVFLITAYLLKLEELRTLITVILRRQPAVQGA
jgi:hypothetical protein